VTGATGLAALAYGYIYHVVPAANNYLQQFSTGAPIPWSNNAVLAGGITHTAGTPTITVPNTGIYRVNFTVQSGNTAQLGVSWGISINGAAPTPPNTVYSIRDTKPSGDLIIPLSAGDTLEVVNTNTALNDPNFYIEGPGYSLLSNPGWMPFDIPAATITIIQIA
ncbi:hypothetical protein COF09_32040, partial [Bacillus toyonensis]|uniref:BclA C-terminal domain-containing protein n=1 Tax=Bacillus toyonensis TaxID=155322 RepID=UPI000C023B60